jgi:hypothetical protein
MPSALNLPHALRAALPHRPHEQAPPPPLPHRVLDGAPPTAPHPRRPAGSNWATAAAVGPQRGKASMAERSANPGRSRNHHLACMSCQHEGHGFPWMRGVAGPLLGIPPPMVPHEPLLKGGKPLRPRELPRHVSASRHRFPSSTQRGVSRGSRPQAFRREEVPAGRPEAPRAPRPRSCVQRSRCRAGGSRSREGFRCSRKGFRRRPQAR